MSNRPLDTRHPLFPAFFSEEGDGMKRMMMVMMPVVNYLKVPVICLIIISIMVSVPMIFNPLRRPRANVRNYILRLTPLGTSIDDVIEVVESRRGWVVRHISFEHGFRHPDPRNSGWPILQSGPLIIGEKSVRVNCSYRAFYKLFTRTIVDIFWGFDMHGNLIEVYVNKYIDI